MQYLFAAALAVLLAWPAHAEIERCFPRDVIETFIADGNFDLRFIALTDNGISLRAFSNEHTGRWVIYSVSAYQPNVMCVLDAGAVMAIVGEPV